MDEWSKLLSARAQVDAIEAMSRGAWPDVDAFRLQWLPGGRTFRDREHARAWLEAEGEKVNAIKRAPEEPVGITQFMRSYQPEAIQYDEYSPPSLVGASGLRNKVEIGFHFDDEELGPFVVQARPYGFFAALLQFAAALAAREGWTEHSTRTWLITEDARPAVIAMKFSRPESLERRKVYRITIDVALDTPPHVLAAEYARRRREEHRELESAITGKKPMAPWSLALVAFAASRNDGRGWVAILDEWNESMPKEWRFTSADLLGRSAKRAYQTLMRRDLDWQGPRGAAAHRPRKQSRKTR